MEIIYKLNEIDKTAEQLHKLLNDESNKKIILFEGSMGAGKTTLIKKLCEKFEVEDEVTSPTFAIVNEYNTKSNSQIYHFDFYRLKSIEEALNIGIEEYFASENFCFIEWGELIRPILPQNFIEIKISEINKETRKLTF